MSGAVWHWLCWVLGAPLALGGLALIWFGVFGDRAKGRRRCPQCWYDLAGIPGLLCPECGRQGKNEGELHRSRRRWGVAAIGLVLVPSGYIASVAPNLGRVGIRGFVPTTLLLLVPTPPPPPPTRSASLVGRSFVNAVEDPWFAELRRRHATGSMWGWQERVLQRRDLARVIWCRERWLVDEPLCVRVSPGWFHAADYRVVKVTPRIAGSPSIELHLAPAVPLPGGFGGRLSVMPWRDVVRNDFPHTLIPVPAGTTEVTFDVEVRAYSGATATGASRVVFRGSVTKPLRVVGTPAEMMTAVDSPELTAAIRRGLGVAVGRGPDGKPYIHGTLAQDDAIPRDLVTGMRVEFFLGDDRVAWGQFRPMAWLSETSNGWVHGDMGLVADTPTDPRWRVVVTGSISSAIRDFSGDTYWSGSFECPYSEVIEQ